jgi:lipopolysaccharide export system permease protein
MIKFLFSRLGRYVFSAALFGFGVTLACIIATVLLVDVVEELRNFSGGRSQISLLDALHLTTLKTPLLVEQTTPFMVLVGTMVALTRLNRRGELVAMRAAGVSAWRFLSPLAATAVALGVFVAVALDPVASSLNARQEEVANALRAGPDAKPAPPSEGIWLRQGDGVQQTVIHAASADMRAASLRSATLMIFDVKPDGGLKFARRMTASRADLKDGFWQLRDVVEAASGEAVQRHAELALPTNLHAATLFDRVVNPSTLSVWRLPAFLDEMRRAGFSAIQYELRWQTLLALPVFMLAMTAIAAMFSLRLQRLGGVGKMAATGAAMGFIFYFANRLIGAFASADSIAPVIAAWAPALAALFGAMAVISYAEDG